MPHNSKFPEADLALRQRVLREFDAVHVLDQAHAPLIEAAFGALPVQTFETAHPHYVGAYPDDLDRLEARDRLGVDAESTALLFFGSIQPYKGLKKLIAAFRAACALGRDDFRLMMTGYPADADYVAELEILIGDDPAIRFAPATVDGEDIQKWFRAADAVVLPYAGGQLNSGAAMLAFSFERPVIAPDDIAFRPFADYGAKLYDPADEGALENELAAVTGNPACANREQFLQTFDPDTISEHFFRALRKV